MSIDTQETYYRKLFDARKPWHHCIWVNGIATKLESAWGEPPDHPAEVWAGIESLLPDLNGKSVLDAACNDGFFVFECARRGADSVTGLETSPHHFAHARIVRDLLMFSNVELKNIEPYAIDEKLGMFDISLIIGLFYRLKNPLAVIDKISAITKSTIIVETAVRNSREDLANRKAGKKSPPAMDFISHPYEPTAEAESHPARYEGSWNWWMPNSECVCEMLRTSGFADVSVASETILKPSAPPDQFGRAIIVGKK